MSAEPKTRAHLQSAPGDFYVVNGECMSCGAPHEVAPDLIGWADAGLTHCIWKKQPETEAELQQALRAFDASCICGYRYAGSDPDIMVRIGFDNCDQAPAQPRARLHRPPAELDIRPIEEPSGLTGRI
ncbi:MAG TPA: hypothetical protein VGP79_03335, partial [Bryobacteraceae bacterium]|nr:hypothetical protein [Bryobacteraceae bacterium]